MNRRDFVLAGAASVCIVPLLAGASGDAAGAGAGIARLDPFCVLYDRRFAQSRAFGAEIGRRGGPAFGIDGDITELWFHELGPRWSRGEGVVAGMTTSRTLLCLERLAWDHRLRVVSRVAHAPAGTPGPATADALVTWIIST